MITCMMTFFTTFPVPAFFFVDHFCCIEQSLRMVAWLLQLGKVCGEGVLNIRVSDFCYPFNALHVTFFGVYAAFAIEVYA